MLLNAVLSTILVFSSLECAAKREPPTVPGLESIDELAAKGGHNVTNYEVITEDGYSLWLHRIGNNSGPPILMQHGAMVAADQWIVRGPKKDLAFMLLDEGFDVWLSNQRGTFFNEYNVNFPKDDPKFWNFSFHESGYYDVPTVIDFVLDIRKKEKVFYIGHSLGTTVFLVMASTRPEYNQKIQGSVLLSPIAFPPDWDEISPKFQSLLKNAKLINAVMTLTGLQEIGHRDALTVHLLRELCTKHKRIKELCLDFMEGYGGKNRENLDMEDYNNFMPYFGAGTSEKTLYHLGQVYTSGEFKEFDYGIVGNVKNYGNPKPPDYPLEKVTAPVAIYWGMNDPLLSEKSVKKLVSHLPNVLVSKAVPDPLFTHFDMYLGKNANIILYPEIIGLLKSLSK